MGKTKKSNLSKIFSIFILIFIVASIILLITNKETTKSIITKYSYNDNVLASENPPAGLSVSKTPQFIIFGFDDNSYSGLEGSNGTGGMNWALDLFNSKTNPKGSNNNLTYDGEKIKASFYVCTRYIATWMSESPVYVKKIWRAAYETGHEIGLHSHNHKHGDKFNTSQWEYEIQKTIDNLTKPFDPKEKISNPDNKKGIGIPRETLISWRTPHLEFNNNTFVALKNENIFYDCSMEEGWQEDQDGTNYLWPYTLDNASPGNEILVTWNAKAPIGSHPGIWEIPVYTLIIPPDDKCMEYGAEPGLRKKLHDLRPFFDEIDGKIVGFDYNLWVIFKMTKAEFLASLKYTLDLRLKGNRAPFTFGAHTDYYSSKYYSDKGSKNDEILANTKERQEAFEEFIDYALSKPEVRIVSGQQFLNWMRNPVPLNDNMKTANN